MPRDLEPETWGVGLKGSEAAPAGFLQPILEGKGVGRRAEFFHAPRKHKK